MTSRHRAHDDDSQRRLDDLIAQEAARQRTATERGQARALAQTLRGHKRNTPPLFDDLSSEETDIVTQTQDSPDATPVKPFTDSQARILIGGLDNHHFKLPIGTAAHRLFNEKLIERANDSAGSHRLTPAGRVQALMLKKNFTPTLDDAAAAPVPPPAPITPAQAAPDARPVTPDLPVEIAALHIQLKQVTGLANDRGTKLDEMTKKTGDLTRQLRAAEDEIERLKGLPGDGRNNIAEDLEYLGGIVNAIRAQMTADGYAEGPIDYVADLREHVKTLAPLVDIEVRYKTLCRDVDAIINMITQDGSSLTLIEYVADLRAKLKDLDARNPLYESLHDVIKSLNAMKNEDGANLTTLIDYVADLRNRLASAQSQTAISAVYDERLQSMMDTLVPLMDEDDPDTTMTAWVIELRRKARLLDQSANKVEALTRQLEIAEAALEQTRRQSAMNEVNAFLACVLDDLAQIVPDVAEYRDNREAAQRAANRLKAKLS
jgi:hypothetical protein